MGCQNGGNLFQKSLKLFLKCQKKKKTAEKKKNQDEQRIMMAGGWFGFYPNSMNKSVNIKYST